MLRATRRAVWALGLLTCRLAAAQSSVSGHDCFVVDHSLDEYATCKNPMMADKNCTVAFGNSTTDWLRLDCDIMITEKRAKKRTSKWIVVHAGVCDTYSEVIGDYYAKDEEYNYFSLRPCAGLIEGKCIRSYGDSTCAATHMSWTVRPEVVASVGMQGFNPPTLVDAWRDDNTTRFVFLHEYGDDSVYAWQPMYGCDKDTPTYVCVTGDDPKYDSKWPRLQKALDKSLNQFPTFDCPVVVVDARNSSEVPGYAKEPPHNRFTDKPCSGVYPQDPNVGWAWEMPGAVTSALMVEIQGAEATGKESQALKDFRHALAIALENGEK